jgi:Raf kinase inhibitor-like YbhB/YbcL family protein
MDLQVRGRILTSMALSVLVLVALVGASCQRPRSDTAGEGRAGTPSPPGATGTASPRASSLIEVESPAFPNEGRIPEKYAGRGENSSPPLAWRGVPPGTKEVVLLMDDPDAPGSRPFVHWFVYGIDPSSGGIEEGAGSDPPKAALPPGAKRGRNDLGRTSYFGPAPPPGPPHRYRIRVFALGEPLGLDEGADWPSVESRVTAAAIGYGELKGIYGT